MEGAIIGQLQQPAKQKLIRAGLRLGRKAGQALFPEQLAAVVLPSHPL
jgi:hypothetical protein